MKKIFLAILLALAALIVVLLFNTFTLQSKQIKSASSERLNLPINQSAVVHLSEAIRIKTISYDDTSMMQNNSAFDSLFTFLHSAYPLVFRSLQDTVLNGRNLLLRWEGSNKKLAPAILYAHMDVVPIEENTLAQWKHAPFSGDVGADSTTGENCIWGRGALDDKGSLISIYEAINKLLSKGFKPERTIYIASGSDEEIGGRKGAKVIAEYCRQNNLHFTFYLDEGGIVSEGVVPGIKKPVAIIGTSEKGYVTFDITVNLKGGHSSHPAKETSIDVLLKALQKMHDSKFEKKATQSVKEFMDYVGPEMPMPMKIVFANRWLLKPLVLNEYTKTEEGNAMVRTTGVTTVINAGVKENVIPNKVSAKVNFRILPGETIKDVEEHVKNAVNDQRVEIKIGEANEPSKTTSSDEWGFKLLQQTTSEVFPDAIVAPFLMLGSTDSKHFADLTDQTYRFFPARMNGEGVGTIHGINERIRISSYMETIKFYEQLLTDMKTFPVETQK